MFSAIKKRDGRIVSYDIKKVGDAIFKAVQSTGGEDRGRADKLAELVEKELEKVRNGETYYVHGEGDVSKEVGSFYYSGMNIPGVEDVQDAVEKVLIEKGHAKTSKAFILYREKHSKGRESLAVRSIVNGNVDTTDRALLVESISKDEYFSWERKNIAVALMKEGGLSEDNAYDIAKAIERKVFSTGIKKISTSLIRELVNNELFEKGFGIELKKQDMIGIPKADLEALILGKSKENSNVAGNNPEAVSAAIGEIASKQYALENVFSREVADAHLEGKIHIHDLGYITRVYCSSHSLEYIKKYGLKGLENLESESSPARHAITLNGHLNTFLASMQANYAGALGIGYINIFYAPILEDEDLSKDYKAMKQIAQNLIYNGSQNAFSRGGQTLFLDFNIHTGIPKYLKNIPAIGPGGEYTGKTYGDYEKTAQQFAVAMLDVWRKGDKKGRPFSFPKCDFHVTEDTFEDPAQKAILEYACQVASENGSPYFVFDRDDVTLSACCRLRTIIEDNYMIEHPESMRFCGFQNVSVNLPQAAYRAGKENVGGFLEEIDKTIDLVVKAHLQKKEFVKENLFKKGQPLYQIGKVALDGKPYVDLDKVTYIVGLVGLNDAIQYLTGRELHEDGDVFKLGLETIAHINLKAKEYSDEYNLKFSLEETPGESANRRLIKLDLRKYPEQAKEVAKGDLEEDEVYYTNSVHLRPDAPVDLVTRVKLQSMFHSMIDSGAIIHAFVGENKPNAGSIYNLVEKTFRNTQTAQLVISPEFTSCDDCYTLSSGLHKKCPSCESEDVKGLTRIVGYYSTVSNWNKSKLGELKDRQKGSYGLMPSETLKSFNFKYNDGGLKAVVYGPEDCEKCKELRDDLKMIKKNPHENYIKRHLGNLVLKDFKIIYENMSTESGLIASTVDGKINPSRLPALVIYDNGNEIFRRETKYGTDDIQDTIISPKHYIKHLVKNGY